MSLKSRSDGQRLVKEAVSKATRPGSSSRVSGAGQSNSIRPEGSYTLPNADGGDRHVFIWGLDEFGDDDAVFGLPL